MQPKYGGGGSGGRGVSTLNGLLTKALHPVKYLGNLGKTYDEAMDMFFKISMESLLRSKNRSWYAGCFITDEELDEYYDTDEIGVNTAIGHVFEERGRKLDNKLDRRLLWSIGHCVGSLNKCGVEASWSGILGDSYYISDQTDMEDASFTEGNKVTEDIATSIYSSGKRVGATIQVIEKYIQLLEVLISFGLNPWVINEKEIEKKYGVEHILMLNLNQMQSLVDTVKDKGWGTL